jgi:ubiquinone/menaquinone biosynthesis C-methylase UbiE
MRALFHFLRHAPATLRLKRGLGQAELYDTLMDRADAAGLGAQRDALVAGLHGDILEIGAGTGRMFPRYAADARVTALEPDATFAERAAAPASRARATITLVDGAAEKLAFPDQRFDAAVVCLVLCSVASVRAVADELRRVLKPGAELRLIEHVRSDRPVAGFLMRALNWLWRLLNGQGCNMHRRPLPVLRAAGFAIESVEPFQVFSAGLPAFPMRRIVARAPGGTS